MLRLYFWIFLALFFFTGADQVENESLRPHKSQTWEPDFQQIRSPLLEVFMRLPPNFRGVRSFRDAPESATQSQRRATDFTDRKTLVDVRKYEVAQPAPPASQSNRTRIKRRAEDRQKAVEEGQGPKDHPMLPVPDAMRGSHYGTVPVKEFDVVDIDEPDDSRRRRTESTNGPEHDAQRDKRTFLEEASAETTTVMPFWKRKKENPPFVTGRGSAQSGNGYTPAQHRSTENSRESHSLKNLDKPVQSNEISRSNPDNYYSSTNRRTYSRQYDGPSSSTPKSVYDIIDYSAKRNTDPPRTHDDRNDPARQPTPPTHEHYTHRHHDRSPYQPPYPHAQPPLYPYPADVLGRGVEYYHRTFDPATGRIVYYANMPDPMSRSLHLPGRPFGPFHPYQPFHPFDPYYRTYVPPFDYRFLNGYVNGYASNYVRNGRSGAQPYSHPFQERDKFQRDAKFVGAPDTTNRFKDESRNKTYIIYDAEESRTQFSRPQSPYGADVSRFSHTPAPASSHPPGQAPFKQFPFPSVADHFPPPAFANRNNFYSPGPMSASGWGYSRRTVSGVTDSKANSRPLHSPEVQLPLTTANRDFDSKSKKS